MSNGGALEVFNFQGAPVRHVVVDGEPWFVLADICAVLGIGNSRAVAARLPDDEVSTALVGTGAYGDRREASTVAVSEAGMYRVVIRSDKPAAEPFLRWLTHEVLPSIRRHGAYATPATIDQILADPEAGIRLLTELKAERDRADSLEHAVAELAPKAERYDHLVDEAALVSMGQAARILYADGSEVGRGRLFDFIDSRLGWLMWERDAKGGRHRVGTQAALEAGVIEHRLVGVPADRPAWYVTQPFLTPAGFNAVRGVMRGVTQSDVYVFPPAGTRQSDR